VSNPAACAKAIEQNGGVLVEKAVAPLYRTPDGSLLEVATG
jgi:hypothetical protein